MLELKNINKSYKKGKTEQKVLKDVSIKFKENGFVSILGPSGCGKTTLLNILGGLDKPNSGKFLVDGKDITLLKDNELDAYRNSKIGFVFQNYNLINHLNVYDNIALSLKLSKTNTKEIKEKVTECLKKVGLEGKEKKKPLELSGGEAQRVAIARAIINSPEIILADEPTGSLDSKTSIDILEILKEISQKKIVIMVTHNKELADKYSDRIITMCDGRIENDEIKISKEENNIKKIKKVHMSFMMSIKLSLKNILSKLFRVIATVFAGSIGIIAVALVITLSQGVSKYVEEIQEKALKDMPIVISSSTIYSSQGNIINNMQEYPDTNEIKVSHQVTNYEHKNYIDDDLLETISSLDENKYDFINYNRSVTMNIYTKNQTSFTKISQSYFYEMNELSVMNYEYDVIYGKMPEKEDELALVIDKYNTISSSILKSLGLDYSEETYTYDDILANEYILLDNDDIYEYNEEIKVFVKKQIDTTKEYKTLKITGIIRESRNNSFDLYGSGIVYTQALTDYIIEKARNSEIGKKQLESGLVLNVLTGLPFENKEYETITYQKEYLYEEQLEKLSLQAKINRIQIYTKTFEDRPYIESQIKGSTAYKNSSNVYYRDSISTIAEEFSTFIRILTEVLIIFAMISLLVSSIMITIITYISVLERQREIGLLRSIGARRKDVISIFCSENLIIGFLSGILGILLAFLIKRPINTIVQNIIKDNISMASNVKNVDLIQFKGSVILELVIGNILITLLAGLIPAIIASLKKPIEALKAE